MESSEVLQQYGISVYKMITEGRENQLDSALSSFVCITAIQVGDTLSGLQTHIETISLGPNNIGACS